MKLRRAWLNPPTDCGKSGNSPNPIDHCWGIQPIRRLAVALLVIVLVIGSAGTAEIPDLPPLNPPVVVSIATDHSATDAGFYIAAARGYFEELGIKARFVTFPSSSEMLPMLASDNVQVGGGITSTSLFNAVDRGLKIRFLADMGHNMPGKPFFTMVVRKGLGEQLQDIQDLEGKRIGLASVGSVAEYLLEAVLSAGDVKKTQVHIVVMDSYSNLTVALMNSAIDAAMHIEPFITKGAQQQVLERFVDLSQILPKGQCSLMVGSPGFTGNLELAGRFMVAYLRGVRDYVDTFLYDKSDEEIYGIMASYTDLKDPQAWKQIAAPGLNPNGYFFQEDLKRQIQWYKDNGYYKGSINIDEVTDYGAVNFALEHLGSIDYPIPMTP